MKIIRFVFFLLILGLSSCNEEPKQTDDMPVKPLIQAICAFDEDSDSNYPVNPPEYYIINSSRDLANLPEGLLVFGSDFHYLKVDFAKNTLIIVTSVIYCEPTIDDQQWNWAMARFDLKKDYSLNIRYSNCSVMPNSLYTEKCKIQFGFTTEKIPSDTRLTLTESMTIDN
ncbi:MAG: hypothetical protein K2K45_05340 [Muribaculaceae bacterium]|nr:hypothetical protein [Muribaculaceae bacterium]